jgi:hypothetical protein
MSAASVRPAAQDMCRGRPSSPAGEAHPRASYGRAATLSCHAVRRRPCLGGRLDGGMSGLTPAPAARVHDPSGVATHGVALWSAGESPFKSARVVIALLVAPRQILRPLSTGVCAKLNSLVCHCGTTSSSSFGPREWVQISFLESLEVSCEPHASDWTEGLRGDRLFLPNVQDCYDRASLSMDMWNGADDQPRRDVVFANGGGVAAVGVRTAQAVLNGPSRSRVAPTQVRRLLARLSV